MELIWRGHSCFVLRIGSFRLMLDPYKEVPGLPDIAGDTVDAVLCSHGHRDHSYTDALHILGGAAPFGCERIATFHDGEGGALRGVNTVHRLTAEGSPWCTWAIWGTGSQTSSLRLSPPAMCCCCRWGAPTPWTPGRPRR